MGTYGLAPQGSPFTKATSGVFVPEIWSTDVIRYRDNYLMAKELCGMIDFQGGKGDKIYRGYISRLAVETKVAGQPVTYQAMNDRRWSMSVNRYKDVAFAIDELLRIQSNVDLRSEYTREASYALARDLDNSVLAERATLNGFNSGSQVITTSVPISFADVLSAYELMLVNNVPSNELVLLVSPLQWTSLIADPLLANREFTSGGSIESGKPVNPLGINIKVSSNIGRNSTTGYTNGENGAASPTPGMAGSYYYPTQSPELRTGSSVTASALTANYHTAILAHKDWCKMALQKTPSVDYEWNVDYQEHHMVLSQIYDVKVFRPDHAAIINSDEEGII